MKLTKAYVEKIASHWARKQITTVKEAMQLAKNEHRQYQQWAEEKTSKKTTATKKKPIRKEMLPSWLKEEEQTDNSENETKADVPELDREQFEAEKKKLFDRIKKYKDNKNN
ncbi:DnaD domain protein [Metabacillus niabensis]|nr:DnaD domain protein [Metabacillus niabensis]